LIPVEADLALESYLRDPVLRDNMGQVEVLEPVVHVLRYFSATTVAIDFLKRLPQSERIRRRQRLVIKEERRGATYPECHVEGLIPYFLGNQSLRVEMHVGLWKNLMYPVWLRSIRHEQSDPGRLMLLVVVRAFANLDEVSSVVSSGIRSDALTVIIEGQQKETLEAWNMIKYVASL
jgi:hypothetical protein